MTYEEYLRSQSEDMDTDAVEECVKLRKRLAIAMEAICVLKKRAFDIAPWGIEEIIDDALEEIEQVE